MPDEYGRWLKFKGSPNPKKTEPEVGWIRLRDGAGAVAESDIEDVALPLYQGVMVQQFDPSAKALGERNRVEGTMGTTFPGIGKSYRPQFLMPREQFLCARI